MKLSGKKKHCPRAGPCLFFFKKEYKNLIERGDCYAPELDLLSQASLFPKVAIP